MSRARITGSAQIFQVRDVQAAARYYRDRLGFKVTLLGEPAQFCIAGRDNHHLMLSQVEKNHELHFKRKSLEEMWDAYFWVDDIEMLYVELDQRGVIIDYGLKVADYGVKEFGVRDLDGYEIAFGQVIKKTA